MLVTRLMAAQQDIGCRNPLFHKSLCMREYALTLFYSITFCNVLPPKNSSTYCNPPTITKNKAVPLSDRFTFVISVTNGFFVRLNKDEWFFVPTSFDEWVSHSSLVFLFVKIMTNVPRQTDVLGPEFKTRTISM